MDSLKQQIEKKAYVYCDACQEGKSYLEAVEHGKLETDEGDPRCPDCDGVVSIPLIEVSDVLKLVGDLEKSHIIKSRKQLRQAILDEVSLEKFRVNPDARTRTLYHFWRGHNSALESLLGDEK